MLSDQDIVKQSKKAFPKGTPTDQKIPYISRYLPSNTLYPLKKYTQYLHRIRLNRQCTAHKKRRKKISHS